MLLRVWLCSCSHYVGVQNGVGIDSPGVSMTTSLTKLLRSFRFASTWHHLFLNFILLCVRFFSWSHYVGVQNGNGIDGPGVSMTTSLMKLPRSFQFTLAWHHLFLNLVLLVLLWSCSQYVELQKGAAIDYVGVYIEDTIEEGLSFKRFWWETKSFEVCDGLTRRFCRSRGWSHKKYVTNSS